MVVNQTTNTIRLRMASRHFQFIKILLYVLFIKIIVESQKFICQIVFDISDINL